MCSDIPLLDNVINYDFPGVRPHARVASLFFTRSSFSQMTSEIQKAKLFIHRVGRVARAGRSGVAYSLVAPDEVRLSLSLSHTCELVSRGPNQIHGDSSRTWLIYIYSSPRNSLPRSLRAPTRPSTLSTAAYRQASSSHIASRLAAASLAAPNWFVEKTRFTRRS